MAQNSATPSNSNNKTSDDKRSQVYAALGVGFVCIIIGFPLWWKTTEVYRVQLPHAAIEQLGTSQVNCRIHFNIIVADENIDDKILSGFRDKLSKLFQDSGHFTRDDLHITYDFDMRRLTAEERTYYNSAKSLPDLEQSLLGNKDPGKFTFVLLPKQNRLLNVEGTVTRGRTAFLNVAQGLDSLLPDILHIIKDVYVDDTALFRIFQAALGTRQMKAVKETMRALRYHQGYEVTFTLLNPQPDILNIKWDIQTAIETYLNPFLEAIQDYADITVKSQYLHYSGLGVVPRKDNEGNFYVLKQEDLPHIINPIEAHLSSHVSNNPSLNFIVYVPTRNQSPIRILDDAGKLSKTNAFLSPRWGGILVNNIATPENVSLPAAVDIDMRVVMEVFISQLRLLLGIQPQVSEKDSDLLDVGHATIIEWEVDRWLRARCLENIASSASTLRSLIDLLDKVGNIVINDEIGIEVEKAVDSIKKSMSFLSEGKLRNAFLSSRQAILASETAFFDPSLLELLYFPEDQKFAIYIPLFLPISIPVILSVVDAFKWITKKEKKEKAD